MVFEIFSPDIPGYFSFLFFYLILLGGINIGTIQLNNNGIVNSDISVLYVAGSKIRND